MRALGPNWVLNRKMMETSLYLLSSMSIPMRPGTSCDTISMLKTWSKNSIFTLPRDGLGLPSPKMYEFSDLLKLCKLPPKLSKVCCPMQLRWASCCSRSRPPVVWGLAAAAVAQLPVLGRLLLARSVTPLRPATVAALPSEWWPSLLTLPCVVVCWGSRKIKTKCQVYCLNHIPAPPPPKGRLSLKNSDDVYERSSRVPI